MSLLFEVIKPCWKNLKILRGNDSRLRLLPGGRKLRKEWSNREAWTHTISTSVFIFNFEVCSLSRDNYCNASVPTPNFASSRWIFSEDVNCCTKVFLERHDRLCIWGKTLSGMKRKLASCFGGPEFLLPQEAMSCKLQSFYLECLKLA